MCGDGGGRGDARLARMQTPRLANYVHTCTQRPGWDGGWIWPGVEARGSGEVHGPQGVVVDLNSFGQRLRVPAVALTGHMAALGTETIIHELR